MTKNAMANWRARSVASGIHFFISVSIAGLAGILVFALWYPYPYSEISGGRQLFTLVVAVDVVLGPLMTLIIFNRAKPRRELLSDLTVVAMLQLAALGYGLWTVFVSRPVHLVFEYSRMTVVHAIDTTPDLLAKAPPGLQRLPLRGPTVVALRPFESPAEEFDATMAALNGAPLAARSDLWQPYVTATPRILKEAKPASDLHGHFPGQADLINQAIAATGRSVAGLRYLPLLDRHVAWTVLLDAVTAEPLGFVPLDSF
jgi:hypothetical protein